MAEGGAAEEAGPTGCGRAESALPARGSRRWLWWIAPFAVLFVAYVVRVVLVISDDFLPARHIDLDHSRLERVDDEHTRLTLVLLDAPHADAVRYDVSGLDAAEQACTVELHTRPRTPVAQDGAVTCTLKITLPAVRRVTVLDKRWDHPRAHPQGHRFELTRRAPSLPGGEH